MSIEWRVECETSNVVAWSSTGACCAACGRYCAWCMVMSAGLFASWHSLGPAVDLTGMCCLCFVWICLWLFSSSLNCVFSTCFMCYSLDVAYSLNTLRSSETSLVFLSAHTLSRRQRVLLCGCAVFSPLSLPLDVYVCVALSPITIPMSLNLCFFFIFVVTYHEQEGTSSHH